MSDAAKKKAAQRRKERRAKPLVAADLEKLRATINSLVSLVKSHEQRLALMHLELQTLRTASVISPKTLPDLIRDCTHRVSHEELQALGWSADSAARAQRASKS